MRVMTLAPPADSPMRVMLVGSPPKLEMLSLIQWRARSWSRTAGLGTQSSPKLEKSR